MHNTDCNSTGTFNQSTNLWIASNCNINWLRPVPGCHTVRVNMLSESLSVGNINRRLLHPIQSFACPTIYTKPVSQNFVCFMQSLRASFRTALGSRTVSQHTPLLSFLDIFSQSSVLFSSSAVLGYRFFFIFLLLFSSRTDKPLKMLSLVLHAPLAVLHL